MHIPLFSKKKAKDLPSIDTKIHDYKPPDKPLEKSVNSSGSFTSNSIFNNSDENVKSTGSVSPNKVGNRSRSNSYRYSQPGNLGVKSRTRSRSVSINYDEPPASPSSLNRRQISDRVRNTPSSYVRHSRVYSNDFDIPSIHSDSYNTANNVQQSRNANSFSNFLLATKSVPAELSPIVTLLNCHNFRNYYNGTLLLFDESLDGWLEVNAKLTGNELSIWDLDDDDFKPKYHNLFDCNISLDSDHLVIKFSNDLSESFYSLIVKALDLNDYKNWLAALYLSAYEKLSLNESFTAVILSLIGPRLSDIHTLLSKKKYVKYDWCNIRLPQVNHKWVKCYLAIYPSTAKKYGKIEIYTSEKVSKKNLICYISKVTNVYNLFPENVNMIEFNSIMKLNGNVYVNSKFEHLFANSTTGHSKSESVNNTDSLSNTLPPPQAKTHERTVSQSSFFSQSSSPPSSPKVKSNHNFIKTNYIYLMPQSHPGVQEIETMIRNYVPIIDAFKLYGRPSQLNSNKFDKDSLLFGLPSLPQYEYLSFGDAKAVVDLNIESSVNERWTLATWFQEFKMLIEYKMANENYKGNGNISTLYKSLELDDSDIGSITSAPDISFPQFGGEFSPSPMGSPTGRTASPLPLPRQVSGLSPSPFQNQTPSPNPRNDIPSYTTIPPQSQSNSQSPLPHPSVSGAQSPESSHSFRFDNNYSNIDGITSSLKGQQLQEPINLSIKQHT